MGGVELAFSGHTILSSSARRLGKIQLPTKYIAELIDAQMKKRRPVAFLTLLMWL
jgi:hypothetical protein